MLYTLDRLNSYNYVDAVPELVDPVWIPTRKDSKPEEIGENVCQQQEFSKTLKLIVPASESLQSSTETVLKLIYRVLTFC